MELQKNEFKTYQGTERARLSSDFVKQYGNHSLNITSTAFQLILAIGPYVDYEGLIQLTKPQMRALLKDVSAQFFVRTLNSALKADVLEEVNGRLYSRVHTFKAMSEQTFVPHYKRFTEEKFPSVGERATRLFAYIMAAKPTDDYLVINIENLYRNKLHTAKNGIEYFHDAKEVVDALVKLLKNDLVEIRLPQKKGDDILLNAKNIADHRTVLEMYVEIKTVMDELTNKVVKRKTRTSVTKVNAETHVLYLKLSSSLTSSHAKVKASETELHALLRQYHYHIRLLNRDSVTGIIGLKNTLYEEAGKVGLALYRNALEQYLKEKLPVISSHDNKKFGVQDHIMNYYLLIAIKKVLLQAAREIKAMELPLHSPVFLTAYGELTEKELKGLMKFYTEKASINHLIIMEKELHDLRISLADVEKVKAPWNAIYDALKLEFITFVNPEVPLMNLASFREIAFTAAQEHLFTQKEKFEEYMKEIAASYSNAKEFPIASGNIDHYPTATSRPKKINFYNWLEDRE